MVTNPLTPVGIPGSQNPMMMGVPGAPGAPGAPWQTAQWTKEQQAWWYWWNYWQNSKKKEKGENFPIKKIWRSLTYYINPPLF